MTLKKSSQALEYRDSIHNSHIHPALKKEMKAFMSRNHLVKSGAKEICCSQCFKAHMITKAKELDLGNEVIKYLNNSLQCELGHEGYYLDENKVIKID